MNAMEEKKTFKSPQSPIFTQKQTGMETYYRSQNLNRYSTYNGSKNNFQITAMQVSLIDSLFLTQTKMQTPTPDPGLDPTKLDDGTILFTENCLVRPTNNFTTELTKALSNSPYKKRLTYGSPRKVFITVDKSKLDPSPIKLNSDLGSIKSTRLKSDHKKLIDKTTENNPNKAIQKMLSDRQALRSTTKVFNFENGVIMPELMGKINSLNNITTTPFGGPEGGYLGVDPKATNPGMPKSSHGMPKSSPIGNKWEDIDALDNEGFLNKEKIINLEFLDLTVKRYRLVDKNWLSPFTNENLDFLIGIAESERAKYEYILKILDRFTQDCNYWKKIDHATADQNPLTKENFRFESKKIIKGHHLAQAEPLGLPVIIDLETSVEGSETARLKKNMSVQDFSRIKSLTRSTK
jgi:hypothetical protein